MAYRVLLADDSITIQKVVELILSDEDVQVESVSDGLEALESLRRYRPDVVLADIEMPRMNGYELCERIKGDPENRSIPVILLAGAFESFDENRARRAGAEEFIIKPFDSSDLIGKIDAVRRQPEEVIEELSEEEALARPGTELPSPEPAWGNFGGPAPQMNLETTGIVEEAEVLGPDQTAYGEDVPEAQPADDSKGASGESRETASPMGAFHAGETTGAPEPAGGTPPQDEETLVVSGEDFDEEDLWDTEEIAVSDQDEDEGEPSRSAETPVAAFTPPTTESAPFFEPMTEEFPSVEGEPEESAAPEPGIQEIPGPEAEEVTPAPVEAEPVVEVPTETEATAEVLDADLEPALEEPQVERPFPEPPEEPLRVEVSEAEEPVAAMPPSGPADISRPDSGHGAAPEEHILVDRLPDQKAVEELLARKLESLLPDPLSIQEALERAISARVSSGLDVDRLIGARLERFETALRESIASTIENRLVPAFTSSVESILWDVIPQATERLMRETVKEAVTSAVNEKITAVSQETLPGLADSLISKIIEKIRTG